MTEPAYLRPTRASYDTVAESYAELVATELGNKPFDRAMLAAFAELVAGPVADLGCGPGRVTAHLEALGVDAFGIDLSPEMVAVARRLHPGLRFEVGSMTALELKSGELGGIVAWYSIIHTPPELLPVIFAEFSRVLAPGGHLLLGFKAGDELRHLDQGYGHPLSLDVYWLPPARVAALAHDAGLVTVAQLERAADEREKGPQAYLIARKPYLT